MLYFKKRKNVCTKCQRRSYFFQAKTVPKTVVAFVDNAAKSDSTVVDKVAPAATDDSGSKSSENPVCSSTVSSADVSDNSANVSDGKSSTETAEQVELVPAENMVTSSTVEEVMLEPPMSAEVVVETTCDVTTTIVDAETSEEAEMEVELGNDVEGVSGTKRSYDEATNDNNVDVATNVDMSTGAKKLRVESESV
jgi:hypothetical protein